VVCHERFAQSTRLRKRQGVKAKKNIKESRPAGKLKRAIKREQTPSRKEDLGAKSVGKKKRGEGPKRKQKNGRDGTDAERMRKKRANLGKRGECSRTRKCQTSRKSQHHNEGGKLLKDRGGRESAKKMGGGQERWRKTGAEKKLQKGNHLGHWGGAAGQRMEKLLLVCCHDAQKKVPTLESEKEGGGHAYIEPETRKGNLGRVERRGNIDVDGGSIGEQSASVSRKSETRASRGRIRQRNVACRTKKRRDQSKALPESGEQRQCKSETRRPQKASPGAPKKSANEGELGRHLREVVVDLGNERKKDGRKTAGQGEPPQLFVVSKTGEGKKKARFNRLFQFPEGGARQTGRFFSGEGEKK